MKVSIRTKRTAMSEDTITMKQARKEFAGRGFKMRKRPRTIPAHRDAEGNPVPATTVMDDVKVRTRSPVGKDGFRAWARAKYAACDAEELSLKLAAIVGLKLPTPFGKRA